MFQHGFRLVVGDGREIIQEFCQWATGLRVVDQGLKGDASADENRGTAENARIAVNESPFLSHRVTDVSVDGGVLLEDRLHGLVGEHGFHLGVGGARARCFGGLQDQRQAVEVGHGVDEGGGVAQGVGDGAGDVFG